MIRRWTGRSIFIIITFCLLSLLPIQAQQNLLQNPGFEGDYAGQQGRGDFTFPAGWEGWFTESPRTEYWMNVIPTGYPHHGPFRRSGDSSLSIAKGSGSFTAGVLQRVGNIPAGAVVRGTAYVYMENNEGTNAQVRIGIGSNIGNNVNGAVTWSDWEKRVRGMHQISVEHVATGGEVTLIVYTTQTWPNDPNAVYVDDAELIIVGQGAAPAEGGNDNPVVEVEVSRPSGVPFVSPQKPKNNGRTVHVVSSGDTIASISVAYGVKIDEILGLNGLERSSILQLGQELLIATPDPNKPQPTNEPEPTIEPTQETPQELAPIVTEEAENTTTPVENPPSSDNPDAQPIPVSLVSQHSASVAMNNSGGNTFSLTFSDNHFRAVQATPDFMGGNLPLNFWTQVWDMNPDSVIEDAILIVNDYSIKLSLSALQFNVVDNSITYTAVIDSIVNNDGEVVDITTIPQGVILSKPDLYFQPDTEFIEAMSMTTKLTSIIIGADGFLCSWLDC